MQTSMESIRSLQGPQTVELQLVGYDGGIATHSIRLNCNVLQFNFPVHHKTFQENVGWDESVIQRNQAALARLFEFYSTRTPTNKLSFLADLITQLNATEGWRSPGMNPYKMNSLLALFAHEMGFIVHWNCLSGKDRTGHLDVETKFLALQLDERNFQNGYPVSLDLDAPLSAEDKFVIGKLTRYGGSFNIQRLNVGLPGTKLKPIIGLIEEDPLVCRFGLASYKELLGLSALASE